MVDHTPILWSYAVATVIALVIGSVIWRHREKSGAIWLTVYLFSAAIWAASLLLATIVDDFALSVFFQKFLYLGVGPLVASTFLFALEYTGRERFVRPEIVGLLSIEPIVIVGLAFANPRGIFYETLRPDPTMPTGVGVEFGLGFGLHTAYSYALLLVVALMIAEMLYNSQSLYRGQAAALLGATVLPWVANAVHVVGPIDADTTPVGFILAGALYAFAIVRYRLIDIVPIARDRVLDNVSDGIFVIDNQDRLIDANPAGRDLLADLDDGPIGTGIDTLFADVPELRDQYHDLTDRPTEAERELTLLGDHYVVQTTSIEDGRDRHLGWLFIVRDVTERKRREEQLERQNERLDRFADLVSHDLRNPLTVASGHLELARETDDPEPHLDAIEESHDRMEAIIDDVLTLARDGETETEPEPVALEGVAERAWRTVDTGEATLSIEGSATVLADRERLLRLFENLYRNSVEHGSTNSRPQADDSAEYGSTNPDSQARRNSVEHGSPDDDGPDGTRRSLTVSVGVIETDSIDGFYVADDGRGLPVDAERAFEDGFTTDASGTGFGLSIVENIATAHGWTVEAGESASGGARFEFADVETVASDDPVSTSR